MTAIIAMQRPAAVVDRTAERKPGLIDRASEVLSICSRAAEAAQAYEELKRLSDAELAKRGLRRADLSRAAFEKLVQSR